MTIVAHFYPNGEFSIGSDTSKSRKEPPTRKKTSKDPQCPFDGVAGLPAYLEWINEYEQKYGKIQDPKEGDIYISQNGNKYEWVRVLSNTSCLKWEDKGGGVHYSSIPVQPKILIWQWRLTPLVYQSVESCDKRVASRKTLRSMTKRMGRNIRNGIYLLEQVLGKDNLSFLTLTLPSLSTNGMHNCVRNWDKMVKLFVDWLRVTLKRRNITLQYVYCTEIQSKRLQSRNEYAPHLHMVFGGRNGKKCAWAVTPKQCRKAWRRAISRFVDEPFDCRALENLQRVKRSAARYMSKYISKGCNVLPPQSEESHLEALRTQWGGMARDVSKAIRETTTRLDSNGGFAPYLRCLIRDIYKLVECRLLKYGKRGFIPLNKSNADGTEYGLFVYCGALLTPTYTGGLAHLIAALEPFITPDDY